ncbi:MAG: ATP-binding cassette domain-containing protein, partial [Thermomicrobiales bacterium]
MALLELNNIHAYYGNIHALKGVSLAVEQGEIVSLIGSNGAGKSTTLKTISGLLQPRQGEIRLAGKKLNGVPAHRVVALGVSQSPEGRKIFPRMTVLENLEMGAFARRGGAE